MGNIRDWEKKVVHMIIGGNGTILEGQQQEIHDLYMGLKGIAAASEPITDRQFLPKQSNVLEDSPLARRYKTDSRKLNQFLLLRVPIINSLPNPAPFTIHYISAPKLILDSVYHTRSCAFRAMVIRHSLKKIVHRCNKYGKLFDRIDDYLTQKDRELSGIEKYLAIFQKLKPALEKMLVDPARRQDEDYMRFVLAVFQQLHLARSEINFQALNGIYIPIVQLPSSIENLSMTDELLRQSRLVHQTYAQNRDCLRLSQSFQKLLITTDSAGVLSKMARSPNLRSVFLDFEFKPVYLPEEHGIAPPTDIACWMRRFQAMSILGSNPEVSEETSGSEDGNKTDQILMECIKEAIDTKANCQIHAEVKVLGYLQGHGLMGKAINSVGINKLCCPACIEYINAMDIAIKVGGTHLYPWHLSLYNQFLSLDQLKQMKERVLHFFKADWSIHLLDQRQRLHSFGNQSESSRGDAVSEIEWSVPETEYDYHKLIQGDYDEKFLR